MNIPARHDAHLDELRDSRAIGEPGVPVPDDKLDFARLLSMLRRRLGLALAVAGAIFLIGLAVTLSLPQKFRAESTVLLTGSDRQLEERVTDKSEVRPEVGDAQVASQLVVLQSGDLARQVIEDENLLADRGFNPYLTDGGEAGIANDPAKWTRDEKAAITEELVARLRSSLDTNRVENSRAITIGYLDEDPVLAARLANAYARTFTQAQVVSQQDATNEALTFVRGKLEELRQQATSDFAAVQNYRVANGLLSTTGATLTEQDISVYNQQVATARAEAAADLAQLNTARRQLRSGSNGDDVGEALESPTISNLRSQRAQQAGKVADLESRYGPKYPDLRAARQELAETDSQIQAEIDRIISSLEAKSSVSQQRLASLTGSLGSAKGTLARNNSAMVALDDLERRAAASQGLYESYLSRFRELSATSGTERAEARLLTPAAVPEFPASPNYPLNLAFALILGVLVGLMAAFFAEMQFRGLTTAEDVERRTGLPFIGLVPNNESVKPHASSPLETVLTMPNSMISESLRGIYGITQLPRKQGGRVLAITSAHAAEGKTIMSAMLGQIASDNGERVVVVDCDIFQRGLSKITRTGKGLGLLDVIRGDATLDEALHGFQDDQLTVLPIVQPGNEGERLMRQGALAAVIAQLRERFDLIIVDCPPLLAIAEAREIAALADGVIVAAKWRSTSDEAVRAAARLLPARLSHYIGVVLTNVHVGKMARYAHGETRYFRSYEQYVTR